jgi:hypothetical protein
MEPKVEITHLSWREGGDEDCPWLRVNATFRIPHSDELDDWNYDWVYNLFKSGSKEFTQVPDIGDPEEYERKNQEDWENFFSKSKEERKIPIPVVPYRKVWTYSDPILTHIEKFDTFHFHEYIADSVVTRSILVELEHYRLHGELPSNYRAVDGQIIYKHLVCLFSYWD